VTFVHDPHNVADGAHALLLATEWPQYRMLDLLTMAQRMAFPLLLDGRNMFRVEDVEKAGITYVGVGK